MTKFIFITLYTPIIKTSNIFARLRLFGLRNYLHLPPFRTLLTLFSETNFGSFLEYRRNEADNIKKITAHSY